MTAKQWMAANGISEKGYYYWLRQIRRESLKQMKQSLPAVPEASDITFAELTPPIAAGSIAQKDVPEAVIRIGNAAVEINRSISDELLVRILKAADYAG